MILGNNFNTPFWKISTSEKTPPRYNSLGSHISTIGIFHHFANNCWSNLSRNISKMEISIPNPYSFPIRIVCVLFNSKFKKNINRCVGFHFLIQRKWHRHNLILLKANACNVNPLRHSDLIYTWKKFIGLSDTGSRKRTENSHAYKISDGGDCCE